MFVDVVGEDLVTQTIIERLIRQYRQDLKVRNFLPARGGQIKNLAPMYNKLGHPIILLTDLDTYECPPELISDWFGEDDLNKHFLFRIAYGEAESWLMADREGFAKWSSVNVDLIPHSKIIDRRKMISELEFPYKPSLYMMREIIPHSINKEFLENLMPKEGAKKGPAYNSTMIPFVKQDWNIENAAQHSTSLCRTIEKLKQY
ncbi:MAG: hypothetical protein FJY10_08870 [Bacteroidetes bacterium]|nr:hypothetical protein [Bacteroidota bacterium]